LALGSKSAAANAAEPQVGAKVPATLRDPGDPELLALVRPLATVASAASGAPGGLFTPTLASGALAGADLGDSGFGFSREAKSACSRFSAHRNARRDHERTALVARVTMELTGQARAFALPRLVAIIVANATARNIEQRSVSEARLTHEEVAARLRRGSQPVEGRVAVAGVGDPDAISDRAYKAIGDRVYKVASRCLRYCRTSLIESLRSSVIRSLASSCEPSRIASKIPRC
jgi:hypothetical protein